MEAPLDRLGAVVASGQKLRKRLEAYAQLLIDRVGNAYRRDRELTGLQPAIDDFPDSELKSQLAQWYAEEKRRVGDDKDEFRFGFGTGLAKALKAVGLDARGQMPVLRVGLFSLRVDFEGGSATVFWGPEVERLKAGLGLLPEDLANALKRWTDDLKSKASEPRRLVRLLAESYDRHCAAKGLPEGSRVPVLELLGEVVLLMQSKGFRADPTRAKFTEYPRVRFSYDLFRLKTSTEVADGRQLRLHVATFDATTSKASALWVPDNEEGEGTYYAHVSFTREAR